MRSRRYILSLGKPKHFSLDNSISVCGIMLSGTNGTKDKKQVDCLLCLRTKAFKKDIRRVPVSFFDLIERKAEAGLCCLYFSGARAFLEDIRELIKRQKGKS